MYRGTTPTYTFTMPQEVDLTEVSKMCITFAKLDETIIMTKTGEDVQITDNKVEVYLTQEETLEFPSGQIKVQLNWLYQQGAITKRACSNIFTITAHKNLIDEVLNNE